MSRRRDAVRWVCVALALLCGFASWLLLRWFTGTRHGRSVVRWAADEVAQAAPSRTLWVHLLRGGLGWIADPVLVVVALVAVVVMLRRGRWREALVATVVWLGANGTVQAIKHGIVPFVPGHHAPELSGHQGVVWGAVVAVALAVAPRWRRTVVTWGAVAVVLMAVGILLTGWHTLDQVLVPLLICAAWTLLLVPFAAGDGTRPARAGTGPGAAAAVPPAADEPHS